jgi:hypothetical protein
MGPVVAVICMLLLAPLDAHVYRTQKTESSSEANKFPGPRARRPRSKTLLELENKNGETDLPSRNSASWNWGSHVAAIATKEDVTMKRGRFSEEKIVGILKEQEAGRRIAELAREHGVSEATLYVWKSK